jgi:putative transposase
VYNGPVHNAPAPQEIRTFFVTTNCHQRRAIFRDGGRATLLLDVFEVNRAQKRFQLHEFVIMPDHLHLLITPAEEVSLEKAVQFIKGGFSFRVKKELGFRDEVWQQSFTEHRVKDKADYAQHREYIRMNPVEAKLVTVPQDYAYSSATSGAKLDDCPPWLKPRSRTTDTRA